MAKIVGTEFSEKIIGTLEGDHIYGLAGDDELWGGNPAFMQTDGHDFLYGGAGNDSLYGGDVGVGVPNVLLGGDGNDFLEGGDGSDLLRGGDGNDFLWSRGGADTLIGGGGNDDINGSWENDVIYGSSGNDSLQGENGDDLMVGGSGSDVFFAHSGNDTIDGTDAARWRDVYSSQGTVVVDLAAGTAVKDISGDFTDRLIDIEIVYGSSDNDRLIGGNKANDSFEGFRGGSGNDTINGGTGYDLLYADQYAFRGIVAQLDQHRVLDADQFWDTVRNIEAVQGTRFADVFKGDTRANTFFALSGDDTIDGGAGRDIVNFSGIDIAQFSGITVNLHQGIVTGAGSSTIANIECVVGTAGQDLILGNARNNELNGGLGDDQLNGKSGEDTLSGGHGDDLLTGGRSSDTFIFMHHGGRDTVVDFRVGTDHLDVTAFGFASASDVMAHTEQVGSNTVVHLEAGASIVLMDVLFASLMPADFLV